MEPRRRKHHTGGEGKLPASAPLANPYVPFQLENPPKYDPSKALIRGTMFTGLDLPFMGMVNKREKAATPKTQLQTIAFAIQELALYLDTHRNDQEALELYRKYQELYKQASKEFGKHCSQLNHNMVTSGGYGWLDDPWPWEYCANKEV